MTVPKGWYSDPASPQQLGWWSGEQWTRATQPAARPRPAQVGSGRRAEPVTAATKLAQVSTRPRSTTSLLQRDLPDRDRADDVWLPWQMVELGHLPWVCVPHGLPAVRMQAASVFSRTPLWVIPLAIFSLLIGAIASLALRVTVRGQWPVCPHCEGVRQRRRTGMWACFGASVVALILSIALSSGGLLLLDIPLVLAALVFRDGAG